MPIELLVASAVVGGMAVLMVALATAIIAWGRHESRVVVERGFQTMAVVRNKARVGSDHRKTSPLLEVRLAGEGESLVELHVDEERYASARPGDPIELTYTPGHWSVAHASAEPVPAQRVEWRKVLWAAARVFVPRLAALWVAIVLGGLALHRLGDALHAGAVWAVACGAVIAGCAVLLLLGAGLRLLIRGLALWRRWRVLAGDCAMVTATVLGRRQSTIRAVPPGFNKSSPTFYMTAGWQAGDGTALEGETQVTEQAYSEAVVGQPLRIRWAPVAPTGMRKHGEPVWAVEGASAPVGDIAAGLVFGLLLIAGSLGGIAAVVWQGLAR